MRSLYRRHKSSDLPVQRSVVVSAHDGRFRDGPELVPAALPIRIAVPVRSIQIALAPGHQLPARQDVWGAILLIYVIEHSHLPTRAVVLRDGLFRGGRLWETFCPARFGPRDLVPDADYVRNG
jgi:hypothetical protein